MVNIYVRLPTLTVLCVPSLLRLLQVFLPVPRGSVVEWQYEVSAPPALDLSCWIMLSLCLVSFP